MCTIGAYCYIHTKNERKHEVQNPLSHTVLNIWIYLYIEPLISSTITAQACEQCKTSTMYAAKKKIA